MDDAVAINRVTPKFFEVFGTPVLSGRGFDQRDAAGRPLVAIVNQAFERQYFTHGAAVGHVIKIGSRNLEIVGVAAVAKYMQLREGTRPVVYAPLAQAITADPQPLRFAFRIDAAPNSSRAVILTALQQFDPRLTVEFRTLSDEIAYSVRREQTLAWSGTLVGLLALSMAALGLYGVFSHFVNRRRTEIAIRIALGADRYAIWNLVLRTALVTVVVGSVLGGGAVIASARWIDSVAFDTRAFDPWTLAATLGVIVAVASAATFMPVRRAGRIDPLRYLRSH